MMVRQAPDAMPRGIEDTVFVISLQSFHVKRAHMTSEKTPQRALMDERALPWKNARMPGSMPTTTVADTDSASETMVSLFQFVIGVEAFVSLWPDRGSAFNTSRSCPDLLSPAA